MVFCDLSKSYGSSFFYNISIFCKFFIISLYSFSWILVGCKLMSSLVIRISLSMFFNFSFIRHLKFDIFTFIVANSALYSLIFATLLHDFAFFLALSNDFMNSFSPNNLISLADDFECSTCLLLSSGNFWTNTRTSSFFLLLVKGVDVTKKGFLAFGVSGWTANWVLLLSQKSQYFAVVSIFGKVCGPQEILVVIHWTYFQELKKLLLQLSK